MNIKLLSSERCFWIYSNAFTIKPFCPLIGFVKVTEGGWVQESCWVELAIFPSFMLLHSWDYMSTFANIFYSSYFSRIKQMTIKKMLSEFFPSFLPSPPTCSFVLLLLLFSLLVEFIGVHTVFVCLFISRSGICSTLVIFMKEKEVTHSVRVLVYILNNSNDGGWEMAEL